MSQPAAISSVVLDRILGFLEPLFLPSAKGDVHAAREAAQAMLDSYEPRTNRELRLVALTIAFGFGALDALSRATDPALSVAQVTRLRGNANALNRAAVHNEAHLDKLHRKPPASGEEASPEVMPASSATADLLSFVKAGVSSLLAGSTGLSAVPPGAAAAKQTSAADPAAQQMSRQERRALERKAEKQRKREQEQARLAQRAQALRQAREMAVAAAAI